MVRPMSATRGPMHRAGTTAARPLRLLALLGLALLGACSGPPLRPAADSQLFVRLVDDDDDAWLYEAPDGIGVTRRTEDVSADLGRWVSVSFEQELIDREAYHRLAELRDRLPGQLVGLDPVRADPQGQRALQVSAVGRRVHRLLDFEAHTVKELAELAELVYITPTCFSPDGSLVAIGLTTRDRVQGPASRAVVLRAADGQVVRHVGLPESWNVEALAFDPTGTSLALLAADYRLRGGPVGWVERQLGHGTPLQDVTLHVLDLETGEARVEHVCDDFARARSMDLLWLPVERAAP